MNRSITRRTVARAAAWLVASAALTAGAQTVSPAAPGATAASMNFQQVVERVVSKGYNDVREVERKSEKLYEISARDAQGRRVELYVDARSGEILREEVKR